MADKFVSNYSSIYPGSYSSLNPEYGNFVGYRLQGAQIGSPTSIQTANQLGEVMSRIREGVKNVEIGSVDPGVFDQIPKQHIKEIHALSKLAGVKISVHAPIIDAAGFGDRGWAGETARMQAERQINSVIEKSHDAAPDENIPVVIHSSAGIPGTEFGVSEEKGEKGKIVEQKVIAINKESGQMVPLEREKKFYPETTKWEKGEIREPMKDIASLNNTEWDQKLTNLLFYKKHAEDIMGNAHLMLADYKDLPADPDLIDKTLPPEQRPWYSKLQEASAFIDNVKMNFRSMFDKAYQYGTDEQKEQLKTLAKQYQDDLRKIPLVKIQEHIIPTIWQPIEEKKILDRTMEKFARITKDEAPKIFVPVEDFAMEKAADTFSNVAVESFRKFKDKSPTIAIENMWHGMAFARGEKMAELINKSRDQFVEKAMERKQFSSKEEAKKAAEKLIGVTWDVGHLNLIRKIGLSEKESEKLIEKETEKVAKMVKHVHLTDNFGHADSHLPPGMGNVPFKKILETLEKQGNLKDVRTIVEAGGYVQHFKKSPHAISLSAFGSPIYGAKMAPYWNQAMNASANYFAFPMAYLPEKHFSMYGSGFSMLPEELGGQIPGTQSRFSGTPTD
jgi:sugar phosphate isomerase/epimerase